MFTNTFPVGYGGTFDRAVIMAARVDGPAEGNADAPDDSGFVISGVIFHPCGGAEGVVEGYGADGVTQYAWGNLGGWSCETAGGRTITLEDAGNGLLYGRFGEQETAFTVTLDSETGEWAFSMVSPFSLKGDSPEIPFNGVDHDGDVSPEPGHITIDIGPRIFDGLAAGEDAFTGARPGWRTCLPGAPTRLRTAGRWIRSPISNSAGTGWSSTSPVSGGCWTAALRRRPFPN